MFASSAGLKLRFSLLQDGSRNDPLSDCQQTHIASLKVQEGNSNGSYLTLKRVKFSSACWWLRPVDRSLAKVSLSVEGDC